MFDDLYDPKQWSRVPDYGQFMLDTAKTSILDVGFWGIARNLVLNGKKGESVLDLGCGGGRLPVLIDITGCKLKYYGLDVTRCYLQVAKKEYPDLELVQGDCRSLPFPNKAFDYTFCANLLVHLPKTSVPKTVSEMCRVSKKAIFLQSYFGDTRKDDVQTTTRWSGGHVFLYNRVAYSELDSPGWESHWVVAEEGGLNCIEIDEVVYFSPSNYIVMTPVGVGLKGLGRPF